MMPTVKTDKPRFKHEPEGVTVTTPKGYRALQKPFNLATMNTPPEGKHFIRPVFSFDVEKKIGEDWIPAKKAHLADGEVIALQVRYNAADAKLAGQQEGELPTLLMAWGQEDDDWVPAPVTDVRVYEDPADGGEYTVEFTKENWEEDPRIGWAD